LTRLARNEDKLRKADQLLDACEHQANVALNGQFARSRSAIMAALHGVGQIASCGWFVSTGAVICKALQETRENEKDTSQEVPAPEEVAPVQMSTAPQSNGVLVLPSTMAGDTLEPLSKYDPQNPFGPETWTPPPVLSRGNSLQSSTEKDTFHQQDAVAIQADSPLESLSVKQLRERMRSSGISDTGCVEKTELVARLRSTSSSSISPTSYAERSPVASQQATWDNLALTPAVCLHGP